MPTVLGRHGIHWSGQPPAKVAAGHASPCLFLSALGRPQLFCLLRLRKMYSPNLSYLMRTLLASLKVTTGILPTKKMLSIVELLLGSLIYGSFNNYCHCTALESSNFSICRGMQSFVPTDLKGWRPQCWQNIFELGTESRCVNMIVDWKNKRDLFLQ